MPARAIFVTKCPYPVPARVKPIDEQLIERYVRWPETLSSDLRETILSHLVEDDAARATADFYRQFYEALDEQEGAPAARIQAFMERLFPSPRAV